MEIPLSLEACDESSFASLPVRMAVTGPWPSFAAAVTAEREAGRKDLFLCSRMAKVERLDGWRWELNYNQHYIHNGQLITLILRCRGNENRDILRVREIDILFC